MATAMAVAMARRECGQIKMALIKEIALAALMIAIQALAGQARVQ